jgi:hypothetical protein
MREWTSKSESEETRVSAMKSNVDFSFLHISRAWLIT